MSTGQSFPVKKAFLYSLIVSVLLSTFLGILGILSGNWGWFQVRILLTTVIISGSSICGLSCGAYLETKREQALPFVGIACSLVGAAMLIAGIWIEVGSFGYWKIAIPISVFAVAFGHLALLSMARLAKRFQWSLVVAYLVILGVACLISFLILTEFYFKGTGLYKLLGIVAIIAAAITVLIPILHWLSRAEMALQDHNIHQASPNSSETEIARLKEQIVELERRKQQDA